MHGRGWSPANKAPRPSPSAGERSASAAGDFGKTSKITATMNSSPLKHQDHKVRAGDTVICMCWYFQHLVSLGARQLSHSYMPARLFPVISCKLRTTEVGHNGLCAILGTHMTSIPAATAEIIITASPSVNEPDWVLRYPTRYGPANAATLPIAFNHSNRCSCCRVAKQFGRNREKHRQVSVAESRNREEQNDA